MVTASAQRQRQLASDRPMRARAFGARLLLLHLRTEVPFFEVCSSSDYCFSFAVCFCIASIPSVLTTYGSQHPDARATAVRATRLESSM
jgi:hypothetical protein